MPSSGPTTATRNFPSRHHESRAGVSRRVSPGSPPRRNENFVQMSDTLMVSVSGVRGLVGKDLTPELVARYAASFGTLLCEAGRPAAVLARDSRTSGAMFLAAAQAGLQS